VAADSGKREWNLLSELLDSGQLVRSLATGWVQTRYYLPGEGGDLVFEVHLQPLERFQLAEIKYVTQLVEEHGADLTIKRDGGLEITFPPEPP
jgi:hypothetical protein